MKWDNTQLKWTREPEEYTITEDKIELSQSHTRICGREPITIFVMTMRQYCR